MEGKLTQCVKGKKEGTWKVMIDGAERYTKSNCSGLVGQMVSYTAWETDFNGKKYLWCKDVNGVGGSVVNTESPKQYQDNGEKVRSMALAYAKDLAAAKVIELHKLYEYSDAFVKYIKGEF